MTRHIACAIGCAWLTTLVVAQNALAVTENFDGGAANWTEVQGDWTAVGGEYKQATIEWTTTSTNETYHRSFFGDVSWTDYTYEATVRIDEGGPVAPILGIFFRVTEKTDAGGYYMFRLDQRAAQGPGLIKAPNETIQINGDNPAEIGRDYVLRVEVQGSDIKCYVDGVLEIEVTDDSFPAGAVGVGSFDAASSFDNVTVSGDGVATAVESGGKLPSVWARLRSEY